VMAEDEVLSNKLDQSPARTCVLSTGSFLLFVDINIMAPPSL
jgi:hypothetical protein